MHFLAPAPSLPDVVVSISRIKMDASQWVSIGGEIATASHSVLATTQRMRETIMEETSFSIFRDEHDRIFGSRASRSSRRMNNDNQDTKQGMDIDEDIPDEDSDKQDGRGTDVVDIDAGAVEGDPGDLPAEDTANGMGGEDGRETEQQTVGGDDLETRIDLVKLVPFDVKLSVTTDDDTTLQLNTFALTDIVTDWMDESVAAQVEQMELGFTHSAFDSVILEERTVQQFIKNSTLRAGSTSTVSANNAEDRNDNRRQLLRRSLQEESAPSTSTSTSTTIASYEGVTLWKHVTPSDLRVMTLSLLEDLERQALLQDVRLLQLIQASSAEGLGQRVMDVTAYINPNPTYVTSPASPAAASSTSTTNAKLELIIVVAIVVACMAFAFLVFSLFWAWRFDQTRRDAAAYRAGSQDSAPSQKRPDHGTAGGTDSDYGEDSSKMTPGNMNMNVVVTNKNKRYQQAGDPENDSAALDDPAATSVYPESVISEDISTSLSAYYRSGMGSRPLYQTNQTLGTNENDMNDNASMSSMEFDGYSLDGYAPSLVGNNAYGNSMPVTGNSETHED